MSKVASSTSTTVLAPTTKKKLTTSSKAGPSSSNVSKQEEPKVRTRQDVSEKLKAARSLSTTTTKSALRRYILGPRSVVDNIVAAINNRVLSLSNRLVEGSIALSGIVKGRVEFVCDEDLHEVSFDNLFDQTTIRQLLVGTDDANQPLGFVATYYQQNPALAPSVDRYSADRNIYSDAARGYLANFKTALRVALDGRIRKFCKEFGEVNNLSDYERMHLLYAINGWTLPSNRRDRMFPMREQVHRAIELHRKTLGFADDYNVDNEDGMCITKQWLKADSNLSGMLRYNILVNRFYEANDMKLFNIVPTCKVKRHFVAIDTWSLYGILKEVGLIHCNMQTFFALKDEHWRSVFKISQLQGQRCTFADSIESDGIALCVHFQRPKVATTKLHADTFRVQNNDVVLGNDPGRINIYYMVVPLPDGKLKTFVLSRRQYYSESGISQAIKHSNAWNMGIKDHLDALSNVTTKGTSLEAHLDFIETFRRHRDALWNEYNRPRWARQRLSLYGGKKRVFARFFNNMKKAMDIVYPNRRIVIAYGAAKFAPGGRNEVSVPTSRAYIECATRFTTVATPEFRTSKVDYLTDTTLQQVAIRGRTTTTPRRGSQALRGVVWSVARCKFVSRDLNAAMNIRRRLIIRPLILMRHLANGPLQQRIVKRIKPR